MFNDLFTLDSRVSFVTDNLSYLIPKIYKHHHKWNFTCPFCDDKQKHQRRGWYYLDTDSYYCFNAGCVANDGLTTGFKLLSLLKNNQIAEIKKDYLLSIKDLKSILTSIKNTKKETPKEEKLKIPNEWVDLPLNIQKYIDDRLIQQAPGLYKKQMKLFWNNEMNRIVIPYIEHGKIVYYQERSTTGGAKYIFPPDLEKQIFGLDNIDKSIGMIYCLEGAFDSIFVKNGIALGGIKITQHQSDKLNNTFFDYDRVYLFDNQNIDPTSYDRISKLAKTDPQQKVFLWPKELKDKDVNEYVKRTKDVSKFFNVDFLKANTMTALKASLTCKVWKVF